MRAHSVLTTAASVLLASTVFVAAQGTQKQTPGAEGGAAQGQHERQQGQQSPQKGDRQQGAAQQEREGSSSKQQGKQQGQKEQQGKQQQGQREEPKGKASERTQGQGGRNDAQRGEPNDNQKKGERTQGQGERAEPKGNAGERNEGQRGAQQGERNESSGRVILTQEQKTRVRETVLQGGNAPRANNVNFSITVGTAVPRSVRVVELPPVLIEYHPEWRGRGYLYFVVNDEIIVVDRNYHIVAVLEV
jgi:hypothetical protein